jgi:hypothetical protein
VTVHDSDTKIIVTRNLDIALRRFRLPGECRRIWIDALCIDQSSIDEKNRQVALMGKIYSAASSVLLWLGPEQDRSALALTFIQYLSRYVDVDWQLQRVRPSDHCPESELHWGNPNEILPAYNAEMDPLLDLFQRPYFKRIWIRQEIALASRAVLYCGDDTVIWDDFRKGVACVVWKDVPVGLVSPGRYPAFMEACELLSNICKMSPGKLEYGAIRRTLGKAECGDKRDKIFATLSLLQISDQQLGIKPDYSQTAEQVYVNVARQVMVQKHRLDLLGSCSLVARALNVPSWTPDWSLSLPTSSQMVGTWSACGWITSQPFPIGQEYMRVRGIAVCRVQTVIGPDGGFSPVEDTDPWGLVTAILQKLMPCINQWESEANSGNSWAETFCSATVSGRYREAFVPPNTSLPSLEQYARVVEYVCSSVEGFDKLVGETDLPLADLLHHCHTAWRGLKFFECSKGYIGLGSTCIQEGDLVSVLLGAQFPVILRPQLQTTPEEFQTWEVVGEAMIPGLMKGEAIYGDRTFSSSNPVYRITTTSDSEDIREWPLGLFDSTAQVLRASPCDILTELDIRVEHYQRKPLRLEVFPETLRSAGVSLEEFVLA